jgi:predicted RNase H-like HicB family nuclease
MHGELVGDSVEPAKTALEEAMQEVEEDMLSKVKKDLTQYLDQLEKKVRVDRELKDKAKDAIEKHTAEEEIEENDYELTDPSTVHGIENNIDTQLGNPQQPTKVMELDDGAVFEIHGDDGIGYEIRHRGRSLPSRFRTSDEAGIAVDLFRAHRQRNRPAQDLSQDYIEER